MSKARSGGGATKGLVERAAARRIAFATEFVVDLNATQAAIRAGYSPRTAHAQGHRMLRDAEVQKLIAEQKRERQRTAGDLALRVVSELESLAFSDIGDMVESAHGGELVLRDLRALPARARRCIESIAVKSVRGGGVSRSVRLHSKVSALKLLMDHLGLAAPVKHEVDLSAKERLAAKLAELKKR